MNSISCDGLIKPNSARVKTTDSEKQK